MSLVIDHPAAGQGMRQRPHFPAGAAGRWLSGERKRRTSPFPDLSGQQMNVIDQIVNRGPARVLIHPHAP